MSLTAILIMPNTKIQLRQCEQRTLQEENKNILWRVRDLPRKGQTSAAVNTRSLKISSQRCYSMMGQDITEKNVR